MNNLSVYGLARDGVSGKQGADLSKPIALLLHCAAHRSKRVHLSCI